MPSDSDAVRNGKPTGQPSTKQIKLLSALVGHRHNAQGQVTGQFSYVVGQVISWPTEEAERFIHNGIAEPVETEEQR